MTNNMFYQNNGDDDNGPSDGLHQDNYDYDTQNNGAGQNNDDDDNGPSLAK